MRSYFSAVAVVTLMICSYPTRNFSAAEPIPREIVDALNDWEHSWVTLRFSFEYYELGNKDVRHKFEYFFTKDGKHRREQETNIIPGRILYVFNMPEGFGANVEYESASAADPQIVNIRPATARTILNKPEDFRASRGVFPIAPLWDARPNEWLPSLVSKGLSRFDRWEERSGKKYAIIQISDIHEMHLRGDRNYLPEFWKYASGDDQWWEWTVTDFQEVESDIWFPSQGTGKINIEPDNETIHWVVTAVAINEQFDKALFQPPSPGPKTVIMDQTGKFGSRDPTTASEEEIVDAARENVAAIRENTWSRYKWTILLLVAAAAFLGIAIYRRSKGS